MSSVLAVILEATGADYLYEYTRISANTGLPDGSWPGQAMSINVNIGGKLSSVSSM